MPHITKTYLNTSHVKVKLTTAISNGFRYSEFKYISC